MKRKTFVRGLAAVLGGSAVLPGVTTQAATPLTSVQPGTLSMQWLYHSCVLFQAGSQRILVNPFRAVGCTASYPAPTTVAADLVLISSRLFDEGAIEGLSGQPQVLFQPGDYQINSTRIQGVRMAHDNTTPNGVRFGINVGWRWSMAGITIVHLGGAAAPITREQEILLANPDILFVPVGGGTKNYDAAGAKAAIDILKPKWIVPTMYRTDATGTECDLASRDPFLAQFPSGSVRTLPSRTWNLTKAELPTDQLQIAIFPN